MNDYFFTSRSILFKMKRISQDTTAEQSKKTKNEMETRCLVCLQKQPSEEEENLCRPCRNKLEK